VIEIAAAALTPGGWRSGPVRVAGDGRIAQVGGEPLTEPQARQGHCLLPGFVDLHVHGGGGADTMEGGEAVATVARTHARHGTTALLATTMTAPRDEIEAALRALAPRGRPAARACWACTSRGPTSTASGSAPSPTSPPRPRWPT
jgi:N-acetylglucosamine-6-phosphate deacetylase